MNTTYNATITIPTPDDNTIHALHTTFIDYHPAITIHNTETQLILTYPATTTLQATETALALIRTHNLTAHALTIETTDHYDNATISIPPLVSVTEAAHLLGITRQAVLQRISHKTIPATRIGDTWAIPRHALRK